MADTDTQINYFETAKTIIIAIFCLYIFYRFCRFASQTFLGGAVKSGPEMDYDLSSEITRLHQMQERNLREIVAKNNP